MKLNFSKWTKNNNETHKMLIFVWDEFKITWKISRLQAVEDGVMTFLIRLLDADDCLGARDIIIISLPSSLAQAGSQ